MSQPGVRAAAVKACLVIYNDQPGIQPKSSSTENKTPAPQTRFQATCRVRTRRGCHTCTELCFTTTRGALPPGPQPPVITHTHTAMRSGGDRRAAACGAPARPPLAPSSSGPMAPAPHKLCATACPMRHTQKDTAPRVPRRPTRAHGGPRLAMPHTPAAPPRFSAGPCTCDILHSCAVHGHGHGTHTPSHNLMLALCGTPHTHKALQLSPAPPAARTHTPSLRAQWMPAMPPMPCVLAARAAACCRPPCLCPQPLIPPALPRCRS